MVIVNGPGAGRLVGQAGTLEIQVRSEGRGIAGLCILLTTWLPVLSEWLLFYHGTIRAAGKGSCSP